MAPEGSHSDPGLNQWFAAEIQPHEPALRAYLQARFPTLEDQDDIIQEAYSRVFRAYTAGRVRYAKALLFTTARNAAFDWFRERQSRPVEAITEKAEWTVLDEYAGVAEHLDRHHELEVLAEAVRALPDRCRQVVMLRFLDNLSYKEIAEQLGISPETVKVHLTKGMRRCADCFAEHGLIKELS